MSIKSFKTALEYRGLYLAEMIHLESAISLVITSHFCPNDADKKNELMDMVLYSPSFGMNLKTVILCRLLKDHYPDAYEGHEDLHDKFKKLTKLRNYFAHRDIDLNFDKGVRFLIHINPKGNNHLKNPTYTIKLLNEMLKEVGGVTDSLNDLIE